MSQGLESVLKKIITHASESEIFTQLPRKTAGNKIGKANVIKFPPQDVSVCVYLYIIIKAASNYS